MRIMAVLALLMAVALPVRAELLAFQQGEWICVAEADGSKVRKITKGVYPDISADGTKIAFNTESGNTRYIAYVDVDSKKVTLVKGIPGNNSFGPVWSQDGRKLAFSIIVDNKWRIGVVDADGSKFTLIGKGVEKDGEVWVPTFAADGESIFCHSLDNIFQVSLEGKVLKKWPIAKIGTGVGMNSGSNLSATADGKSLVADFDMDENFERKDWDGPPPAVWIISLADGKGTRLSPGGTFEWSPRATPKGGIVCQGLTKGVKPSIFLLSPDGKTRKLLVRDASTPSASR